MGFFDRVAREVGKGIGAAGGFLGDVLGGALGSLSGAAPSEVGGLGAQLGRVAGGVLGGIFPGPQLTTTGFPGTPPIVATPGGGIPIPGFPPPVGLIPRPGGARPVLTSAGAIRDTQFLPLGNISAPSEAIMFGGQQPMTMHAALPGGAPIVQQAGLGGGALAGIAGLLGAGAGALVRQFAPGQQPSFAPDFNLPFGGTFFRPTMRGVTAKHLVMLMHPVTGNPVWYRNVGRPILFSGDAATCRRVRKVSGKAFRSSGGRR